MRKLIKVELSTDEALEIIDAIKVSVFAGTYANDTEGRKIALEVIRKLDDRLYADWLND